MAMTWIESKRVVVTGATSGIGREVATRLASLGAEVILVCRDRTRGEAVASEIHRTTGAESATVMTADVSDQSSIRAFARRYRDIYGALDVLVNNAGVLLPDRRTSVDGIELTFATNVLGYHLVTTELLDALSAAAPSRVVNVASTFTFAVDIDDLQFERRTYDGLTAYAQSKALDRMLTWAFARRLDGDSITLNAMAPGLVLETRLYRDLSGNRFRSDEQNGAGDATDCTPSRVAVGAEAESGHGADGSDERQPATTVSSGAAPPLSHRGDPTGRGRKRLAKPTALNTASSAPSCQRPRTHRSRLIGSVRMRPTDRRSPDGGRSQRTGPRVGRDRDRCPAGGRVGHAHRPQLLAGLEARCQEHPSR